MNNTIAHFGQDFSPDDTRNFPRRSEDDPLLRVLIPSFAKKIAKKINALNLTGFEVKKVGESYTLYARFNKSKLIRFLPIIGRRRKKIAQWE